MPAPHAPVDPPNAGPGRRAGERRGYVRGLTVLGAAALIVGNMVGTSVYTLPASLAKEVGPLGLLAWLVTAGGYLFVALVYALLGTRYPKTGGPYVFVREAFGEFAAFQTVWSYWFSSTIGNAAIAAGAVGYFASLWPALEHDVPMNFALAQVLLWSLCALNVAGVKHSARLAIACFFLNIVPLLLLSAVALTHFDAANLTPFAPAGWSSLPLGAALIVWAYSGIESATVPAEEVDKPETTIRRGTMLGYAIGTLAFLTVALAVAGAMPNADVAASARPIAATAERVLGPWAARAIGVTAILAALGTLNGWILMAGRIPVTAAEDGLFFPQLARIHPRFGTPHTSLWIGGAVASAMLFMLFSRTLLEAFNFIALLAILTTLLPHLYAMAACLMLVRRDPERFTAAERRRARWIAPIAFAYVLFTIYGVGPQVALWGFLVVLAGTPLFILFKTRGASA